MTWNFSYLKNVSPLTAGSVVVLSLFLFPLFASAPAVFSSASVANPSISLLHSFASPNAQSSGLFGNAVALNGASVVVGAPQETVSGKAYAGRVYVFSLGGVLLNTLTSPNSQYSGEFGLSVAASSSYIVVGAPFESSSGFTYSGHVYVYTSGGTLVNTLSSPNAQASG